MPELLFLCHRVPYPPDKGEKIRAWHELSHLAKSHHVHLGCLADDPSDLLHLGKLHAICASVGCFPVNPILQRARALACVRPGRPLTLDIFYSSRLRNWVNETLSQRRIDRIFVFSSAMAQYAAGLHRHVRILDMVDVDSEKWRAYARHHSWAMRAVYNREAKALLANEREFASDFDLTLFVSETEAQRFAALVPECQNRISWVDNGVDLERFSPTEAFSNPFASGFRHVVFTGTMNYWPNVDAVNWFARAVLPRIQEKRPETQFHIVGAAPTGAVKRLTRRPDILVTGRVADVRPFLTYADVVVAPLRVSRGIQNKVLEAMAMARPVVATPQAFEGLRVQPGRDLLVTADPTKMADLVLDVLDGRYPRLGSAGRRAVESGYRWSHLLRGLDRLFPSLGLDDQMSAS